MKNRPQRGRTKTNLSLGDMNIRPLRGRNLNRKHIFYKHLTPLGSVNVKLDKFLNEFVVKKIIMI
jgi:hypothetical protein